MRAAVVLAVSLAVATSACTTGGAQPGEASVDDASTDGTVDPYADSASGDDVVHTYAPTYNAVWNEILLHTCATEFCHAGSADYLHLYSEAIGYQSLVDAAAQGPQCSKTGLLRVNPYHPETSLLYLKVTNPPCGSRMPLSYGNGVPLDAREIEQIGAWISCGALDGDAGCPVEAGADAQGADAADAAAIDATTDAPTD
jgi:hypothetical protein